MSHSRKPTSCKCPMPGPGLLLHDAVSASPFFEMDTLPAGQVTEAIASPWLQTRLHSPSHLSCLTTCRPVDAAGPAGPGTPCSVQQSRLLLSLSGPSHLLPAPNLRLAPRASKALRGHKGKKVSKALRDRKAHWSPLEMFGNGHTTVVNIQSGLAFANERREGRAYKTENAV
jgi:hypothetical protein